jgi:hypothetical protein
MRLEEKATPIRIYGYKKIDNIMQVEEASKEELKTRAKSQMPPAG